MESKNEERDLLQILCDAKFSFAVDFSRRDDPERPFVVKVTSCGMYGEYYEKEAEHRSLACSMPGFDGVSVMVGNAIQKHLPVILEEAFKHPGTLEGGVEEGTLSSTP
jgi:hypothetical protein